MITAVSANLACGGAHNEDIIAAAHQWVSAAVGEGIDLLFLQECPRSWAEVLDDYQVIEYVPGLPAYRCRSAVAVRRSAAFTVTPMPLPTANYHRSYLAAAEVAVGDDHPFVAVSVHAGPNHFRHVYREDWPGQLPDPRPVRVPEQLWDADLVLETLRRVTVGGHLVLAAGGFNEARAHDDADEPWAAHYFQRAAAYGLGDVTYRLWNGERATHGDLQIDHILASPSLDKRVGDAQVVTDGPLARTASDHHPIRWSIDPA